jgi:hypothetical protein
MPINTNPPAGPPMPLHTPPRCSTLRTTPPNGAHTKSARTHSVCMGHKQRPLVATHGWHRAPRRCSSWQNTSVGLSMSAARSGLSACQGMSMLLPLPLLLPLLLLPHLIATKTAQQPAVHEGSPGPSLGQDGLAGQRAQACMWSRAPSWLALFLRSPHPRRCDPLHLLGNCSQGVAYFRNSGLMI